MCVVVGVGGCVVDDNTEVVGVCDIVVFAVNIKYV